MKNLNVIKQPTITTLIIIIKVAINFLFIILINAEKHINPKNLYYYH